MACTPIFYHLLVESVGYSALLGRCGLLPFERRELARRQRTKTRVRAQVVVVVPPPFDGLARFPEAAEHVLVEALVAQLAIERFHEGVLHPLARLHVVPRDPSRRPAQHRAACQFGSVVADYCVSGVARSIASRSSSRTARTLPSEVSTTVARHSRL